MTGWRDREMCTLSTLPSNLPLHVFTRICGVTGAAITQCRESAQDTFVLFVTQRWSDGDADIDGSWVGVRDGKASSIDAVVPLCGPVRTCCLADVLGQRRRPRRARREYGGMGELHKTGRPGWTRGQ